MKRIRYFAITLLIPLFFASATTNVEYTLEDAQAVIAAAGQ